MGQEKTEVWVTVQDTGQDKPSYCLEYFVRGFPDKVTQLTIVVSNGNPKANGRT